MASCPSRARRVAQCPPEVIHSFGTWSPPWHAPRENKGNSRTTLLAVGVWGGLSPLSWALWASPSPLRPPSISGSGLRAPSALGPAFCLSPFAHCFGPPGFSFRRPSRLLARTRRRAFHGPTAGRHASQRAADASLNAPAAPGHRGVVPCSVSTFGSLTPVDVQVLCSGSPEGCAWPFGAAAGARPSTVAPPPTRPSVGSKLGGVGPQGPRPAWAPNWGPSNFRAHVFRNFPRGVLAHQTFCVGPSGPRPARNPGRWRGRRPQPSLGPNL